MTFFLFFFFSFPVWDVVLIAETCLLSGWQQVRFAGGLAVPHVPLARSPPCPLKTPLGAGAGACRELCYPPNPAHLEFGVVSRLPFGPSDPNPLLPEFWRTLNLRTTAPVTSKTIVDFYLNKWATNLTKPSGRTETLENIAFGQVAFWWYGQPEFGGIKNPQGSRHCWYWPFPIVLALLWVSHHVTCHIVTSSEDEHAWQILSEARRSSWNMGQTSPTIFCLISVPSSWLDLTDGNSSLPFFFFFKLSFFNIYSVSLQTTFWHVVSLLIFNEFLG